ncbi:MAG TPA: hypothetical protein G4O13_02605 [Dehalococcoidia bacterium]|nr:hypothetical protein [Dehalococcoidia bacterium]
MSFIIAVYVPEGIVMASDSRQAVTVEGKAAQGKTFKVETVNSDAITKTFLLEHQQIGIANFGQDLLGGVPMASHIKGFIEEELSPKDDVTTVPKKLVDYFRKSFPDADAGFHIGGYKKEGRVSVPHIYSCHISQNAVERRNIQKDGSLIYGAAWSGQGDILTSIINAIVIKDEQGNDKVIRSPAPIIWKAMALQDAIDFAIYAIRTTIDTMRFQARPKNVGGPIDVLVLTPDEAKWIQSKELHGSS